MSETPRLTVSQVANLIADEHLYDDVKIMVDSKQYIQPSGGQLRVMTSLIILMRDIQKHPILNCSVSSIGYSRDYRWWTFNVILKKADIEALQQYLKPGDKLFEGVIPEEDLPNGD